MQAMVTNIQGYSIHDGAGIRTIVFFKGCTLACHWCSNPEGISPLPEIGLIKTLCTKCGKCADVCPQEALIVEKDSFPLIDRQRCTGCGECIPACIYNALVLYGKQMSIQEVFAEVSRDSMFFQASGGGVTASGGEPLYQSEFVYALFNQCHQSGIHTCLETSGNADSSALRKVLSAADYVLFDLKHLNSSLHRKFTGKPNNLVLENASILVESGVEFLFRMPLIPGINDSSKNVRETADFLKGLGNRAHRIELLPYHRLGESKYEALDRLYPMHGLLPLESAHVEAVKKAFEECGIQCSVSR